MIPDTETNWKMLEVLAKALSQTLAEAAGWAGSAPILHFINLRETEAEREQPVLLADGPRAGKAEALTQPQHRLVWGVWCQAVSAEALDLATTIVRTRRDEF